MIRVLFLVCMTGSALWAQNVVSESAIHQAVERHVRAALNQQHPPQERCEIHTRWKGDVVLEEQGPVAIAVKPLSARPLRGASLMRVELKVQGRTCRVLTVTVDTRIFKRVLVASRSIRRGEVLGGGMFAQEERDITLLRDGCFSAMAQVEGLQARRPMNAGDILTHKHSEGVPLVRRGEVVQLVLDSGNMHLSAQGEALQDGGMGVQIRVRNQDSGKILRGQVVAAGIVRMGGGEASDE